MIEGWFLTLICAFVVVCRVADTENIRFVFAAVKDTILQLNLKEYNLVWRTDSPTDGWDASARQRTNVHTPRHAYQPFDFFPSARSRRTVFVSMLDTPRRRRSVEPTFRRRCISDSLSRTTSVFGKGGGCRRAVFLWQRRPAHVQSVPFVVLSIIRGTAAPSFPRGRRTRKFGRRVDRRCTVRRRRRSWFPSNVLILLSLSRRRRLARGFVVVAVVVDSDRRRWPPRRARACDVPGSCAGAEFKASLEKSLNFGKLKYYS